MMNETSRDEKFIAYLEGLRDRDDKGALAILKRGLGKPAGTDFGMAPYIERWNLAAWDRARYYLVASLFASHPMPAETNANGEPCNMGDVFADIVKAYTSDVRKNKDDARKSVERRFVAILNAHSDDLPRHLRHAVSLAKSKNVPVDYLSLLRDLRDWDKDEKYVQQKWACRFWRSPEK